MKFLKIISVLMKTLSHKSTLLKAPYVNIVSLAVFVVSYLSIFFGLIFNLVYLIFFNLVLFS